MHRVIIIVQLLLLSCTQLPKKQTDLSREGLHGPVSRITETYYGAVEKFGEAQKEGLRAKVIYFYNEQGEKTEENYYEQTGFLSQKLTYKHDEEGNILEEACYYDGRSLSNKRIYTYSPKNNLIISTQYSAGGQREATRTTKVDKNGWELEVIDKWEREAADTTVNKYNEKGNLMEQKKGGSANYTFTIKYNDEAFDEYGNWKTRTIYDDKGDVTMVEREFKYYKPKK